MSRQSPIHYNKAHSSGYADIAATLPLGKQSNSERMEAKPAVIPLDDTISIWTVGLLSFALGLVLGCIGTYFFLGRYNHTAKLRDELSELRERFSDYRDQVTQHFMRTSELVQEMTQSYRAVYEHLAAGAQELCEGEGESPAVDTLDKELLADDGHSAGEGYGDDLLGDTPRISDLKITLGSEKSQTRQH